MKKVILLVLALGIYTISLGQNANKTTSIFVETKYEGDSTITTKTTTTTVNGKSTTETEVTVERTFYDQGSVADVVKPAPKKKETKALVGLSFLGSFINDNGAMNSKLGMRDINDFNFGLVYQLGAATPFGLEIAFDLGFEGSSNRSNNKYLGSFFGFLSLNAGYPVIKLKNEKFMVVPRVGIGVSSGVHEYVRTTDNNLTMDSIAGNAWSIRQTNFYVPIGLELRFGSPSEYFVIAGEYRHTFHFRDAYLSNSKQKVTDFPELGLNNVAIRLGFVGMF
ncbi:MAG: hypothetical protein PHN41_05950 [Bacteroidales bacterium]|jgi:hypothetical protein|nr:hypothetical protein [Bacteroidales bacterium]MDD4703350.1 hypothetical protein [Bacteroidales bacterium]MDX9798616.1 hypothetical protein [Bacteroidales bacterium]